MKPWSRPLISIVIKDWEYEPNPELVQRVIDRLTAIEELNPKWEEYDPYAEHTCRWLRIIKKHLVELNVKEKGIGPTTEGYLRFLLYALGGDTSPSFYPWLHEGEEEDDCFLRFLLELASILDNHYELCKEDLLLEVEEMERINHFLKRKKEESHLLEKCSDVKAFIAHMKLAELQEEASCMK